MIYVNNEKANLKDHKSQVGKEYAKALDYFNKIGWPVRFKVKKQILSPDETEDGRVFMVMPSYYIHHSAIINTEYGTEQWRYSPNPPIDKNVRGQSVLEWPKEGRGKTYNRKVISFKKEQADLVFFLWFKSKPFQSIYDIDDAKAQAEAEVRAKMDAVKLDSVFYNESSVLHTDENKLRTIARAYNVSQVDTKDKNQVLVALDNVVRNLVKSKVLTVDEFMESLSLDTLTELSAKIQKAHDDKLITFDDKQNTWFYVDAGGRVSEEIVRVPMSKTEHKYNYLRDFFMTNTRKLEVFLEHIENDSNKALTIDLDNLESLDWTKEILPFINAVGIAGTGAGRTKAVVYNEIREKCR
jgi:hypothetical protein